MDIHMRKIYVHDSFGPCGAEKKKKKKLHFHLKAGSGSCAQSNCLVMSKLLCIILYFQIKSHEKKYGNDICKWCLFTSIFYCIYVFGVFCLCAFNAPKIHCLTLFAMKTRQKWIWKHMTIRKCLAILKQTQACCYNCGNTCFSTGLDFITSFEIKCLLTDVLSWIPVDLGFVYKFLTIPPGELLIFSLFLVKSRAALCFSLLSSFQLFTVPDGDLIWRLESTLTFSQKDR